jgi:hypothetical protein
VCSTVYICLFNVVRLNSLANNWLEVGLLRILEHSWHWERAIEFLGFCIFSFFLWKKESIEAIRIFLGQFCLWDGFLLSYLLLLCSSPFLY